MKYRPMHQAQIRISEIGFGSWNLDQSMWGQYDKKRVIDTLLNGFSKGINFVDTAEAYQGAETLIGSAVRLNKRTCQAPIYIASKVQPQVPVWIPSPHIKAYEAFPGSHIRRSTEESLKRLGVDCLDLQQLHAWSSMWLNEGDWEETLERLREEGKIRAWGVSVHDHDPESALQLAQQTNVDAIQVMYNLFDQSAAESLFQECHSRGIAIIARSALYEGGLTGFFDENTTFDKNDWRHEYFHPKHLQEVIKRAFSIQEDIADSGQTLAEFAIQFSLSHPAVTSVILGMRSKQHMLENIKVSDGPVLTWQQVEALKKHDWLS